MSDEWYRRPPPRSTTRQRLLHLMGPLLVIVFVILLVACYLGMLAALIVSAHRGDVAWTVCWGSLLIVSSNSTTITNRRDRS